MGFGTTKIKFANKDEAHNTRIEMDCERQKAAKNASAATAAAAGKKRRAAMKTADPALR